MLQTPSRGILHYYFLSLHARYRGKIRKYPGNGVQMACSPVHRHIKWCTTREYSRHIIEHYGSWRFQWRWRFLHNFYWREKFSCNKCYTWEVASSSGVLLLREHRHGNARPYYVAMHLRLKILEWPVGTAPPTGQTWGWHCRSMDTGKEILGERSKETMDMAWAAGAWTLERKEIGEPSQDQPSLERGLLDFASACYALLATVFNK